MTEVTSGGDAILLSIVSVRQLFVLLTYLLIYIIIMYLSIMVTSGYLQKLKQDINHPSLERAETICSSF